MSTATGGLRAPWLQTQLDALLRQRGHAWLLHGPSGLGQYTLALDLARTWLCEHATPQGACGHCRSCHAIDVRSHADLAVLMPETEMLAREWPLDEKAQQEIDDKKRKPSKEIRVEAMRAAVEFCQRTNAGGRGKVVMVFPADRMNAITANALLKTLEEPVGDARFVLATDAVHRLLPTIRSRCLAHALAWPDEAAALRWLQTQDLPADAARTLLKAAGGRPDAALQMAAAGRDARQWAQLPQAVVRGDTTAFKDWSGPELVEALQKICHDMQLLAVGAVPRYFETPMLPKAVPLDRLIAWGKRLAQAQRSAEHPFNAGLMLEALVSEAQIALNSGNRSRT
jgi:DNA polymerase-3 subunit delta'